MSSTIGLRCCRYLLVIAGMVVASACSADSGPHTPVAAATASHHVTLATTRSKPVPSSTPSKRAKGIRGLDECQTTQFTLNVGRVQGASGTAIALFSFINRSTSACVMRGFPQVEFHTDSGQVVREPARPGGGIAGLPTSAHWIVVEPGGQAWFNVAAAENRSGNPCPTSRDIAASPPGDTRHLIAHTQMPICGDPITVSPMRSAEVYRTG